jgi:hypothetical protein
MAGILYGREGGRERLDGGEGGGERRRSTGWRGRVRRRLNSVGPRVHVGLLGNWKGRSVVGYLVLRLVRSLVGIRML